MEQATLRGNNPVAYNGIMGSVTARGPVQRPLTKHKFTFYFNGQPGSTGAEH
jgi:hypothetical protein